MLRLTQPLGLRIWLILLLLPTLIVSVGCEGTSSGSAGGSTPMAPLRFSELVAPPDVSFTVAFTAQGLYFNAPERFVWRQGGGATRWDIVTVESGGPDTGWMSMESDRSDDGLPYKAIGCVWHRQTTLGADGSAQARVSCSESGSLEEGVSDLSNVVSSLFDQRLPDQTIAGRRASCYSFDDPTMSLAVFCVDPSEGIPLLLSTVNKVDPGFTQDMRAVSVSSAEQRLEFPVHLYRSPVDGWWVFEGVVPISALQLPDFSQFDE
jgi:hypothetical protein